MTILTPQEALQAIADGKKLEYKWHTDDEWYMFYPLINGVFLENIMKGKSVFRLAQEMITIGDVSFPKPESNPLKNGTEYWVADPTSQYCTTQGANCWGNDDLDKNYFRRNLVHLSKENAIAHAKALIKLSGGNVDE